MTFDAINPEQADVDRSALRASSAVEVGATNSPERATRAIESRIREGSPTGDAQDAGLAAGETATVPSSEQSEGNGSRDRQHVHSRQTDDAKHGGQDGQAAAPDHATNSPERAQGSGHLRMPTTSLAAREADKSAATNSPSAAHAAEAVAIPQAPQIATAPHSVRTSSLASSTAGEPQDRNEPVSGLPATPIKTLSKADQIRRLRPDCIHADNLELCGGQGKVLCQGCKTAAAGSEAA